MKQVIYTYEVEPFLLMIDDLGGTGSVLVSIDQVLAEIEGEIGSLAGKHIIWRGYDRVWDLLLPEAKRNWLGMDMYPLGAATVSAAKEQLQQLVASGRIPGIIP